MSSTVLEILTGARLECRDPDGIDLSNELGMSILNKHLGTIHRTLVNIQSELIRARVQIVTVDGTQEYTLTDATPAEIAATGIMEHGIWKDKFPGSPLGRMTKSDMVASRYDLTAEGEPAKWYPVLPNKIGFYPIPDDEYTYNVDYWTPKTKVTALTDEVPYSEIFDEALMYWVALSYNASIGADTAYLSMEMSTAYKTAMQYVYQYGTAKWAASGDMFSIDGV